MPKIFDNINNHMSDRPNFHGQGVTRLDACEGYINLRG